MLVKTLLTSRLTLGSILPGWAATTINPVNKHGYGANPPRRDWMDRPKRAST